MDEQQREADLAALSGAMDALLACQLLGTMNAYPAKIDGVRCLVISHVRPQGDGKMTGTPIMVVVNDELAAKMDLTEARSEPSD